MKVITANEISDWTTSEPRKAQETIPLLIWKLVLASGESIHDSHFPYGKSTQYNGYDGILITDERSSFFPAGISAWEIGTNVNAKEKFNSDYTKRTNKPNNINISKATFCFVTSRIWNYSQGIAEATAEKIAEGKWKSVRIIDANSISMWLASCPTVNVWFSQIIGKPILEFREVEEYWQSVINNTSPQLNEQFFSYNRKPVVDKIISKINKGETNIVLVSSSALEAVLFFTSTLSTSDNLSIKKFAERCLIVNSQTALNDVNNYYDNLIILTTFVPSTSQTNKNNNIWLIPVCRFDPLDLINKDASRIEIPPRTLHDFCKTLEILGYDSSMAYTLGHDLRCSFPALFRKISKNPIDKLPPWTKSINETRLVPALFAGSWEEQLFKDKSIISMLAGKPYSEYIESINDYTSGENAPIFSIAHSYMCIAISDMWDILWNRITSGTFERFKKCFITVFSEEDPTYELPESKWYMASVLGKSPSYSNRLKESLIVSMIMLIERDEVGIRNTFSSQITEECSSIVNKIFTSSDTINHWRTLCSNITTFIEATPDIIIRILEEKTSVPNSVIWELFTTSDNLLFGRNFYTQILSALEKMIWIKRYATRALNLIIRFAEKNFEYKIANSPADTLNRIFCLWHPQNVFTVEERKHLLSDIIINHHSIAPQLVSALISNNQTTIDITKPKWTFIESNEDSITISEYNDMKMFITEEYLNHITPCYADWTIVIADFSLFYPYTLIISKFRDQSSRFTDNDKLELCKEISQYIGSYRKFNIGDAKCIDDLEKLYYSVLPNSPFSYIQFFTYDFELPNPLPFEEGNFDYEAERQQIFAFQYGKIKKMIDHYGVSSTIRIASKIENNSAYASIVAEIVMNWQFNWRCINEYKKQSPRLAECLIVKLYQKLGFSIIKSEIKNINKSEVGWILSCMPISNEITNYIEKTNSKPCQRSYWNRIKILNIDSSNNALMIQTTTSLLKYNRPYTLIEYLSYSDWYNSEVAIKTLQKALDKYPKAEVSGLTLNQVGSHCIERVFLKLYSSIDLFSLDVSRLEFAYIEVFEQNFVPKCIVNQLLSNPKSYFELLTTAYKPDNGIKSLNYRKKKHMKRARSVLNHVHQIPGLNNSDGKIDENIFFTWVSEVTKLCKDHHYSEANDIVMGNILSYAPVGQDDVWPAECIRRIFESAHTDSLEKHFIIGKENQRGVFTSTNGKEEEDLANQFNESANKIQLLYPKSSSILREIGNNYHYAAKLYRENELKEDL